MALDPLTPALRLRRLALLVTRRWPVALRRRLVGAPPRNDRGDVLDEDLWWLLALDRLAGPGIARATPADARRRTRTSAALVAAPRPAGLDVTELELGGRPARRYHPGGGPAPVLLYLHGGGWAVGDLDTHDALCARLAAEAGWMVVSLDYRRAPEHPFPAAVHDVDAALDALRARAADLGGDPDVVAVGGDSAGGNLAAVACRRARDAGRPLPAGQVLIYPATDLRRGFPSHRALGHGFFLQTEDIDWYLEQYGAPLLDVDASPLLAPSLAGLPRAIVTTAGFDPLRDEGEAYAAALAEAGVDVVTLPEPGLVHAYANMDAVIPAADAAVARLVAALRAWRT